MKVAIILALVAAVSAGNIGYGGIGVGVVNTGGSVRRQAQDAWGNYNFGYQEHGPTGGTSRQEAGNAYGGVVGSYTLGVADGRQRRVDYVADKLGFRAKVSTNEPGTAPSILGAATVNAGYGVGVGHGIGLGYGAGLGLGGYGAGIGLAGVGYGAGLGLGGLGHGIGYGAGLGINHVAGIGHGIGYGGLGNVYG
jgi:hypothetical protein